MSAPGWGRATRSGVVWTTLSFLATKCSTFLATLVLARLLAPSEFGVVAAVLVFLTFVELVSDVGMKATVVFEQERDVSARVQTAFTLNLLVAVALTGVAVALAPVVAGFLGMAEHADLFRLASLNLLVVGLANIQDSLLLRELAFRRRAVPEVSRALTRGAVQIGLASAGLGAAALVVGMLVGNLVWTAVLWTLTRFRPTFALDRAVVRSMLGYASGAMLLQTLSVLAGRFDAIVIGKVLGPAALGLYTIAFRIPELVIDSVAWNLSTVMFPALSRRRAEDRDGLARATLGVLRLQALFGLPAATGLALLAPPLVVVLFGASWAQAGGVMSAVAVMSGLHALVFPLGDALKAVGRQGLIASVQVVELPLTVALVIVGAPAGILVVAWLRAAVMVLHAVLIVVIAMRALGISPRAVLEAIRPALVTAAGVALGAGAVRLAWEDLSLLPLVAGGAAAALGALLALRLGAPDAIAELRRHASGLRPAPLGAGAAG